MYGPTMVLRFLLFSEVASQAMRFASRVNHGCVSTF